MKRISIIILCFLPTIVFSQIVDNNIFPNGITFESYEPSPSYSGNHIYSLGTWDIDSILDSGTPMLIEVFATWNSPTWTYHNDGTLNNLYNSSGFGGSGDFAMFSIEIDDSTPENELENSVLGDWVNDTGYPIINSDTLGEILNVTFYPQIIIVCPDHSVYEVGQATESNLTAALQGCAPPPFLTNDPRIISHITEPLAFVCGGQSSPVDITVSIQNYGNAQINGSYNLKAYNASMDEVASIDVILDLDVYEITDITIGSVTPNLVTNIYSVAITTFNDDLTNDSITDISITTTNAEVLNIDMNTPTITLNMELDINASEVGIIFDNGLPITNNMLQIHNDAVDGTTIPIGFTQIGSMTNGDSWPATNYTVSTAGCHYFLFIDSAGDGITYQNSGGNATISTSAGANKVVPGSWDEGTFVAVDFQDISGVENNIVENLSIYPNPAINGTNVSLSLTENSNIIIDLVNTLGQIVYTKNLGSVSGEQNVHINTSNFDEGVYLVNISINGIVVSKRVSLIK